MAVGDLTAKLFCDSSNFDKNIKKSQKEVQEFKRKTEQNTAKVNNAFNSMGSAVGKVNPKIGSLVGSLGKLGTVAAVGGAAIGGLSEIIKHNEYLTDAWEKTVEQASGALDTLWTTMAQGANSWRNLISNLKESISLCGKLADIKDNLGTLEGFALVSSSNVEAKISKYKEVKKNPNATKEQIAKSRKEVEDAINRDYVVTLEQKKWLKEQYKTQVEGIYGLTNGRSPVNKEKGLQIIRNFIEDKPYYNRFKEAASKISSTTSADKLIYSKFFKSLVKNLFGNVYDYKSLFDPKMLKYNRGTIAGLRDFIKNLDKLPESTYLRPAQDTLADINSIDATASARKNAYFKQLDTDPTIKPGKSGSIYTSRQEAPKERTLQDILDDLDKNLAWNKYLAQNLGEDVTGANLSTLEKTANELKDLLKDTTDEEQRTEIIRFIKSLNDRAGIIAVNSNKKPTPKKEENEDYLKAYDIKSAFYDFRAIASEKRVYSIEDSINNGKEGKPLLNSMIEKFKERGLTIKFDVESLSDEKLLKASGWNAEKFFNSNVSYTMDTSVRREGMDEKEKLKELNIELGKFKEALSLVIAKARNSYIARRGTRVAPNYVELDYSNLVPAYSYLDNKLRKNIPGSGVNSSIYGGDVLSATYLSDIDSIKRKYTGFGDFQTSFKNYAIENFLRNRQENKNFDTQDILPLIYDAYKKALADNPDVPKYYKSIDDIVKENPLYNEQHPHKELFDKVKKIINYKNLSLLALEDLKSIDKLYTSTEINGTDITNNKASKFKLNLLDQYKTVPNLFMSAGIDSPYVREEILDKMLESLNNLRSNKISEFKRIYSEEEIDNKKQLLAKIKKIQEALILLIKEKEKTITDEELKRLNELRNDSEFGDIIKGNEKQSTDFINGSIADYKNKEQSLTTDLENFNKHKENFEKEVNKIDEAIENTSEAKEGNSKLIERAEQYKKITNNMYEISNAAAQLGSAFSSLDNKFGDIASSIFNIIEITAEAIGKILGMATAEGTLSAMKLPWPKNLVAVATVVAAGASIAGQVKGMTSKKYATGGIVSGPGTGISDSIPIRVSNGEMILNHRQQSNLFNLLDKGGSSNSKLSSGEVEFKISGSSLVGVLRNYNNVNNKIR